MLDDLGLAAEVPATPPTTSPEATTNYGDFNLNDENTNRLVMFLQDEITRSEGDTMEFRERVRLLREFVDPKDTGKDFPWPNASNTFVPIPRMVLDALKASVKQTIVKQRSQWLAKIVDADAAGLSGPEEIFNTERAFEEFCNKVSEEPGYLDLKKTIDEWIEEILITGIGPAKLIVENNVPSVTTRSGKRELVVSRGPRLYVVTVGSWVWPTGVWRNVQDMPWCGDWVDHTAAALRRRAEDPWNYKNVEEVIAGAGAVMPNADVQQTQEAIRQTLPVNTYRTYDIFMLWDAYGDGGLHDVHVTYNHATGRLHRVIYNQSDDGMKPYEVEVGSPRAGNIFGRGIIEPLVQPVRAINTAVNQTFDSQTLANAPSVLYPEDSEAARVLQSGFFPGMPLPYKETKDEIGILKFPDASAASFQLVQFFMTIVERLTRVGPSRLGEVSQGRRTPASLGLALQQTGQELVDELIDRFRDTMGRVQSRAVMLYYDDDPGVFERLLGPEKGVLVKHVVDKAKKERKSVREYMQVQLTASSATRSIELERQNALATAQVLFGWYRQVIELIQLAVKGGPLGPPSEPEQRILLDILKSSQEQMKRLVELANQPDSETLVPEMAQRLEDALFGGGPASPSSEPGGSVTPPAGPPTSLPVDTDQIIAGMGGG